VENSNGEIAAPEKLVSDGECGFVCVCVMRA